MGMDVYGKAPTSEEGEYFRASIWGWRPIAEMLRDLYPEFAAKIRYLDSNDGDGLEADDATALGKLMQRDERIPAYVNAWNAAADALPPVECEYCEGTGVRRDKVGCANGMPERNWCNGCDGKGKHPDFNANYRMDHEHIREFVTFVGASGGFEIC